MGGTLDIPTIYYPLQHLAPCTFNIAIGLRTRVCLRPYSRGWIKISSRGFEDAQFRADAAPFDHPLGLMFATAAFFHADGIHIEIESRSPPRSALGGSSAAAVALTAALLNLKGLNESSPGASRRAIALLAYQLEQATAGVACGFQDQLAAAYGGVNAWYWRTHPDRCVFRKDTIVKKKSYKDLQRHLLLAYCGNPHVSRDINSRWLKQFLRGEYRSLWAEIIACTRQFTDALAKRDYAGAAVLMNRETAMRREMTPDVLDEVGQRLADLALQNDCGARFTGAGGGGCLWAVGEIENIDRLRSLWQESLLDVREACLLDLQIDAGGVSVH